MLCSGRAGAGAGRAAPAGAGVWHTAPASSLCWQLLAALYAQSVRASSSPVHSTFSCAGQRRGARTSGCRARLRRAALPAARRHAAPATRLAAVPPLRLLPATAPTMMIDCTAGSRLCGKAPPGRARPWLPSAMRRHATPAAVSSQPSSQTFCVGEARAGVVFGWASQPVVAEGRASSGPLQVSSALDPARRCCRPHAPLTERWHPPGSARAPATPPQLPRAHRAPAARDQHLYPPAGGVGALPQADVAAACAEHAEAQGVGGGLARSGAGTAAGAQPGGQAGGQPGGQAGGQGASLGPVLTQACIVADGSHISAAAWAGGARRGLVALAEAGLVAPAADAAEHDRQGGVRPKAPRRLRPGLVARKARLAARHRGAVVVPGVFLELPALGAEEGGADLHRHR